MEIKFKKLDLDGLLLFSLPVFKDRRGFFKERFREEWLKKEGVKIKFIQDNHSRSKKGVLRGLHYSVNPFPQAKLVSVISGKIFDVAVDLRKSSPTFGKYKSVILSGNNNNIFFIPVGFAHGFQVLSERADVIYKTSNYYTPNCDMGIVWNDPQIRIDWPIKNSILSEKDKSLPLLKDAKNLF